MSTLSSSSDNNRPITKNCQKFDGAKNVFQKLAISKYSFSFNYIVLADQLDKIDPGQISFATVEEKHFVCFCYDVIKVSSLGVVP